MKIGIISDSHDNVRNIRKAIALFVGQGAEVLIHSGDIIAPFSVKELLKFPGPVYGVFGNNDGEIAGIKKLWNHVFFGPYLFELGGLRILVCHDETEISRALYENVDVRIFGHDHRSLVRQGKPLDINPGETGGWLYGNPTCALLDTDGPKADILEIA